MVLIDAASLLILRVVCNICSLGDNKHENHPPVGEG